MADDIELANFQFNIDEVVRSAAKLKKEILSIKETQKILKDSGREASAMYVENEADLSSLTSEYRNHIKVLKESNDATIKASLRQDEMALALDGEARSIKEAREQNKLLNELRNTANLNTHEGTVELGLLNAKLDENNKFIKENVDAYTKQKIGIGDYAGGIREALGDLDLFNGGIGNVTTNITVFMSKANESGGVFAMMKSGIMGAVGAMKQMTKAALQFILTPVGAVLAVVAGAFLLIKNAMGRSEESTNKISKAFAAFSGFAKGMLKILEPIGVFLIDGLVKGFELVEKAVMKTMKFVGTALRSVGLDSAADNMDGFTAAIEKSVKSSKELADAEAKFQKLSREGKTLKFEYMKAAEEERQIRDDISRSQEDRIAANERLGNILVEQSRSQLLVAKQALTIANLRIEQEGRTEDALNAQAEALTEIASIEEEITGKRSEQLVNRVALEKEYQEKAEAAADKRINAAKEELDLFLAQQDYKSKTLDAEIALEKQAAEKKKAILDDELKSKKISKAAYQTAILEMEKDLAQKQAELAIENASSELDKYRLKLSQQQEVRRFLDEEELQAKVAQNDALFLKEQEFAALRLEQGLINQTEFDAAITELTETNRLANKAIKEEREAVEKQEKLELDALAFEERLDLMMQQKGQEMAIEAAMADEQRRTQLEALEADKANNLISEELYQARLADIERKYNAQKLRRSEILAAQEVQLTSDIFGAIANVIDQNSKAGKAIALAQALINTYQGITAGVKLGYPAAIPAVAAAAGTGFKAVKEILKTDMPSASGSGSIKGGSGSQASNMGSNITSGYSGKGVNLSSIAGSGNTAVQNTVQQQANTIGLSDSIKQAVAEGARTGTSEGAKTGIVELSENKAIQTNSTF